MHSQLVTHIQTENAADSAQEVKGYFCWDYESVPKRGLSLLEDG